MGVHLNHSSFLKFIFIWERKRAWAGWGAEREKQTPRSAWGKKKYSSHSNSGLQPPWTLFVKLDFETECKKLLLKEQKPRTPVLQRHPHTWQSSPDPRDSCLRIAKLRTRMCLQNDSSQIDKSPQDSWSSATGTLLPVSGISPVL